MFGERRQAFSLGITREKAVKNGGNRWQYHVQIVLGSDSGDATLSTHSMLFDVARHMGARHIMHRTRHRGARHISKGEAVIGFDDASVHDRLQVRRARKIGRQSSQL